MPEEVGREPQIESPEIGGGDAAVRHDPRDQHGIAPSRPQHGFQVGSAERVHPGLAHYRVALGRREEGGIEAFHDLWDLHPVVHLSDIAHVDDRIPGGTEE